MTFNHRVRGSSPRWRTSSKHTTHRSSRKVKVVTSSIICWEKDVPAVEQGFLSNSNGLVNLSIETRDATKKEITELRRDLPWETSGMDLE